MVFPLWLAAMNRRSLWLCPARWNSSCFGYGAYAARRFLSALRRCSVWSASRNCASLSGGQLSNDSDGIGEFIITQAPQRLDDLDFLGQEACHDAQVAGRVFRAACPDRRRAVLAEIVGEMRQER